MREFSKRLKELRQEVGLSIRDLSEKIGVSATSVCRWENDKADVSGDTLIILSKFFKVSAGYLLGLEE